MSLVTSNMSFELFSFDPEWKDDQMEELLLKDLKNWEFGES